jgi:signal transduction histidine kinase/anti-sigma regulatory factor (Ser/Thr protein kinase)
MIKRTLIGERPFEFSARVTLQLGRESISSSTVAISELIKNSYDADATDVGLNFHIREASTSTLVIEDNGNGMNADTLFDHWLKIGTDYKASIGRSPGQRILTGAKGLGRLGIDRLCKRLVLYSKTKGMEKAIQLNVNWNEFENTTKSLSEIKHKIYEVELPITDKYGETFLDAESSGTRLILIGLKDNWDQDFLSTLENELRLLTSPFKSFNDFSIHLRTRTNTTNTEKTLNSEEVLRAARWSAFASIDEKGQVSVTYKNHKKPDTPIENTNPWDSWIKNSGATPLFGPIEFHLYYLAQDAASLKKLKLSVTNFRDFMRVNQGVRIYRDNFRVRPYGEPSGKGDWLDIGLRKASSPGGVSQPGWKIGPNQIIGSVLISRGENSILNDQANREGIVENSAFYQLRTFLIKIIDTLETLVQKDASNDTDLDFTEELANILRKSNEEISTAIKSLKSTFAIAGKKRKKKKRQLQPDQLVAQRLAELEALTEKQAIAERRYFEALQFEKNELQFQKNTLSNLASIGILTISFGHEVRQHSGFALNGTSQALSSLQKINNDSRLLDDPIEFIKIAKDGAKYIDNFSRFAIENIKPDKRTRRKVNIPSVFAYVFKTFHVTLEKMKIRACVNLHSPNISYDVYAFEIDWESIAINLMTNSIWAIEASSNRETPLISVDIAEDEDGITVIYKDSGIGLEAGTEESIFTPMSSGKRDGRGNTIGTGMGLSIVRSHIEDHMGGSITAIAKSDLGGAEFTIKLPTRGEKQ